VYQELATTITKGFGIEEASQHRFDQAITIRHKADTSTGYISQIQTNNMHHTNIIILEHQAKPESTSATTKNLTRHDDQRTRNRKAQRGIENNSQLTSGGETEEREK
jgi:hypothetical protein